MESQQNGGKTEDKTCELKDRSIGFTKSEKQNID